MDDLLNVLRSLAVGVVAGGVFGVAGLPVPAPPTVAGIIGIVGLAVGYAVALSFKK